MRYEDGRKAKTREKIVKEAADAIRLNGSEQISVAAVMNQAGLTHGGFYAHFKNKNALIAAAIEQMFQESLSYFDFKTQDLDGHIAVAEYIKFYLSLEHYSQRAIGCPMALIGHELPKLDAHCQAMFAEGMQQLFDKLAVKLQEAAFEQPSQLSRSIFSEMVGAMTLARCATNAELSEEILNVSHSALTERLGI